MNKTLRSDLQEVHDALIAVPQTQLSVNEVLLKENLARLYAS